MTVSPDRTTAPPIRLGPLYELREGDRPLICYALARLASERPTWDREFSRIADQLGQIEAYCALRNQFATRKGARRC